MTVNAKVLGTIATWRKDYIYFHCFALVDITRRSVSQLSTQYLENLLVGNGVSLDLVPSILLYVKRLR